MSTIKLDVNRLKFDWNPFKETIWGDFVISKAEINKEIKKDRFSNPDSNNNDYKRIDHIIRIAWFVAKDKRRNPILVDFTLPPPESKKIDWPIIDGNHRFAAAIVRNDPWIEAEVSGEDEVISLYEWKEK
jgi:hypothetical protein